MALAANAGTDQTVTDAVILYLTGTATAGSYPLVGVEWTQVSGPDCSITRARDYIAKVFELAAGTYVFRLTVTDQNDATASDTISVTVTHAAGGPVFIPYPEYKDYSRKE